ncbi:malonate decarboxylase subunit delta [Solimicrobium silvestre]|uniref:Malonate decarboxylase acyl carrier protein n=1 Tax=Solimicrobium silvestre TaxID=2099400 RepID=A0A2S9H423_9BURK|nr:malonate decarboxylase subunit delta [Solimicrobium silvestre]PRC94720.1 Malonate decarboxylase acyl carrier protein [Solimicrobium silvestre]
MEKLNFEFDASTDGQTIQSQVMVGVVGSGDLEVLIEPDVALIRIQVTTSVDGMRSVWGALMHRLFSSGNLPAMSIELNDFGATPGVVRLRIEQALEELGLTHY